MRLSLLIVCFLTSFVVVAAPDPPQPIPLDGPPPPGDPIDGILIWLIITAIAFGYYKIKTIYKSQEN